MWHWPLRQCVMQQKLTEYDQQGGVRTTVKLHYETLNSFLIVQGQMTLKACKALSATYVERFLGW